MKKDDALMEICAAAAEMLHMVDAKKYPIASVKYNHIRRLASNLMTHKPKAPAVRTYSYKPELRAAR